ncbi:MAG TPA: tetratricopeptide repeat protein, partial [Nitrolancea sp.]|nr:tetratricopeptide repeat protein [Nitrolancea sp.]
MSQSDSTLPAPRTVLIGRERELATVNAILNHPDTRLLTLTGVGGGGKTHLAREIAREVSSVYPRRTWMVELAAITEPSHVPLTVATALGLRGVSGMSPLAALTAVLRSSPAFLILDNCEHVIDACAALAERLLADCPDLRILATSREPLQIAGERQYRLPTLETPGVEQFASVAEIVQSPAVRLFVARAQDVAPDFRLTPENAFVVARICSDLDGIPLALELAAARVRVLGVEQIQQRLDDSIRLLTGGSRVAPTRQQTLRATLDWSDALLTSEERSVFQRLAVFAGAFSLEAAEAVCASDDIPADSVLDMLTRLVDKSLVVVSVESNMAWYRVLEPVRQYAMGQLAEFGDVAVQRDRHAGFYTTYAERASTALSGPEQDLWLVRLEREQGNLRKALEWTDVQGDGDTELRLATGLVPYWEARGYLAEGERWLRQALDASEASGASSLRVRALRGTGRLAFLHAEVNGSNYDEAEILHTHSLRLAQQIGDEPGIAAALNEMGMVYRLQRDFDRANACLLDALERFRALDDAEGIALVLLNLGTTASVQGD